MSLQTKYRPKTFDKVVGQEHVLKSLPEIIKKGKQQTFLFEGPSGTGKTTLARICAYELGANEHGIVEIDAASNTGVDAMRQVTETASYATPDGSAKVIIVDECHRLSKQAWESSLKHIEEPPKGTYWIFCTTEGNKILETIRTRCITMVLKPVSYSDLVNLVKRVCVEEDIELSEEVISVVAREARGSPRQALVNIPIVLYADNRQDAAFMLNQVPGDEEAINLARLVIKQDFNFNEAMRICNELKDSNPESIRQTVRAYATTALLGENPVKWHRAVLEAFITPAIESNYISDILSRIIRLEKWKNAR